MSNQITTILPPTLLTVLVVIIGYIGKAVVKLVPMIIDNIVAKIGLTNYTKLKVIATDIFYKIEEDARLGKLLDSKTVIFENLLKIKFSSITDDEINILRQAIAGEFNKDKPIVVQAIEKPA